MKGKITLKNEEEEFPMDRLNNVRGVFLFSCYTGLAYADVFSRNDITIGMDGEKWLFTRRQKTETPT
jgi:hypothetical protein